MNEKNHNNDAIASDDAYGDVPDWQLRRWYDHVVEAMADLQEENNVRAYDRLQGLRDVLDEYE